MYNLFVDLPAALPEELVTVLAEGEHVRIERIVSTGQAGPEGFWYDQDRHEWVFVLTGEARLLFEDCDEHASRMATISAWAVGSFADVTRFHPRPTT